MPRLFIGIKCSELHYLVQVQSELKRLLSQSSITWVDPANFHITLKFIGDTEEPGIGPIVSVLDQLSKKHTSASIIPHRLGTFGRTQQPSVIWFGYHDNHVLTSLQIAIESGLTELGIEAEQKRFVPHLTLGRIKYIQEKKELDDYLFNQPKTFDENFDVVSFQLMESILRRQGPEYQVLREFRLVDH